MQASINNIYFCCSSERAHQRTSGYNPIIDELKFLQFHSSDISGFVELSEPRSVVVRLRLTRETRT